MDLHGQIINLRVDAMPTLPLCGGSAATREALAYKVGHRDARHAAAELALKADACIESLRALMAGNDFRTLQGIQAWHCKQIPAEADLNRAREALAAFDGWVLVSG